MPPENAEHRENSAPGEFPGLTGGPPGDRPEQEEEPQHPSDEYAYQEDLEGIEQYDWYRAGAYLQEREAERANHALEYAREICGDLAAYRLESAITDSRELELRRFSGDPATYGREPHEKYVQCVDDLPRAVEAKQAISLGEWDQDQLHHAVDHEVNRMGFRLHLEIQDRLLNQVSNGRRLGNLAMERGMSEDVAAQITNTGENKARWAELRRDEDNPTYGNIENAAHLCIVEMGIRKAVEEGDEARAREFSLPIRGGTELEHRAEDVRPYIDPEDLRTIENALLTARRWTDQEILDGAMDYHARYASLQWQPSNTARERWLTETGQEETRPRMSGDCITRA